MLIFIGHELSAVTGASVYLDLLYRKCSVKKEIRRFHIGRVKLFWLFYNILKFCHLALTHRHCAFHLNSATNLYLAIIAKFFNLRFVLHIHETPEFLGSAVWKSMLFKYVEENLVFVDRRLAISYPKGTLIKNYVDVENMNGVHKRVENALVFAVIGSIDRNKSQLTAIEFLKNQVISERLILKLIGPLSDQSYLAKVNEAMRLANFTTILSGLIEREQIHSEYDILLACSNYESYGLAVAEALILQKPVVFLNPNAYPKEFLECDNAFEVAEKLNDKQIQRMLTGTSIECQKHVLQRQGFETLNRYYEKNFDIIDCFQ